MVCNHILTIHRREFITADLSVCIDSKFDKVVDKALG